MSEQMFNSLLRIAGIIAAFGGAAFVLALALMGVTLLWEEWFGTDDACAPKETK